MREIKFRAWFQKGKAGSIVVVEPSMEYNVTVQDGKYAFYDYELVQLIEGIPLMQYTGLKDKNGVEVYEGDVLCSHYFDESDYKTLTSEDLLVVQYDRGSYYAGDEDLWEAVNCISTNLVVGNIYQNPELIKE